MLHKNPPLSHLRGIFILCPLSRRPAAAMIGLNVFCKTHPILNTAQIIRIIIIYGSNLWEMSRNFRIFEP